jgi:transposase
MDDVDCGLSSEQAARKYSITARTISAWKQLRRETGGIQPRQGRTGPPPKLHSFREAIEGAIRQNPNLTLAELRSLLKLPCCLQTLWNALRRWGHSLKKNHPRGGTATP